jgi:hypothetical protein
VSASAKRCDYCGSDLEIIPGPAGDIVAAREGSAESDGDRASGGDSDRPLVGEPDWVIVASFANIEDWHRAAAALNHANIPARDVDDPADPDASALAVLAGEAAAAHRVLAEWRERGASSAER